MYDQIKTEENKPQRGNITKLLKIIGIVVGAIVVIILLVLLFNMVSKNNSKKPEKGKTTETSSVEETLSIESPRIVTTYNYVTYGRDNANNKDYFLTNRKVTIDNFDNAEKIFYATQFLDTDNFLDTGKISEGKKVYAVAVDEFEKALKKFFGKVIPYNKSGSYQIVLPFSKDGGNLVNLVYDENLKSFKSTFNTAEVNKNKIKSAYTKLTKAKKKGNTLVLTERVIYTSQQPSGANMIINIYSDYAKTRLIESKTVATNSIDDNTINIDDYMDKDKANTIEYKFHIDDKNYYFESSAIKN